MNFQQEVVWSTSACVWEIRKQQLMNFNDSVCLCLRGHLCYSALLPGVTGAPTVSNFLRVDVPTPSFKRLTADMVLLWKFALKVGVSKEDEFSTRGGVFHKCMCMGNTKTTVGEI